MNNLFLMGYRGSGKTTAAECVAAELGWNWCDADVVLEARAGRTIRQIFAEGGEAEFRDLESAVVADLAAGQNQIIALGGGAILRRKTALPSAGAGFAVGCEPSRNRSWHGSPPMAAQPNGAPI